MQTVKYDVCLSFAGEDRPYVDRVAARLKDRGVQVFYDRYEQVDLWGRDLYQHLDDIYRNQARFCILFISSAYATKTWARHELASAQARALTDRTEYILPARFDDTVLPGLKPTTGYLDLRNQDPEVIADIIVEKIQKRSNPGKAAAEAILAPRLRGDRTILVLYSGVVSESVQFVKDLDRSVRTHEILSDWPVISPRATGREWLPPVLRQIRKATVVVVDVTGLRPNVLLEAGLTVGVGHPIVFATATAVALLPMWLRHYQLHDASNMTAILAAISASVNRVDSRRLHSAVPNEVVWLQMRDAPAIPTQQVLSISELGGLKVTILDESSPELTAKVARAALLIAIGRPGNPEPLMSFLAGVILAKPYVGSASRTMRRRVLLCLDGPVNSALSRHANVSVIAPTEVVGHFQAFAETYRAWLAP